ncbi:MAG: hypothetical protein ACFFCV_13105 [Promethearchaeota archaeon]
MVKYNHCKNCKKIYSTTTWIGEVHTYDGLCPACNELKQDEELSIEENLEFEGVEPIIADIDITESAEEIKEIPEMTQSSQIENEKRILSSLEQRANEVLYSGGSIDVLIKEIKMGLVDKAKDRIEETFQSFDVNKIDAQNTIGYVEKTFEYLSDYKDYMDNVVTKLKYKPKMNVKTAIEKVFRDTISDMPKDLAKDILNNKKTMLKIVNNKALKWYDIYSDTSDALELTKKMTLHPFNEIQKKLSTLPFYSQRKT